MIKKLLCSNLKEKYVMIENGSTKNTLSKNVFTGKLNLNTLRANINETKVTKNSAANWEKAVAFSAN